VSSRVERASSFDVAIKRTIGAMARNEKLSDLTHQEVNQEFQLWQGSRLWLLSKYEGSTLTGEHYRIQNTSVIPMRMDEREFYKPGVLAVSIEIHQLASQEATDVYIVREASNVK
jgi:conjugal transfer pilus assembly protein TraK